MANRHQIERVYEHHHFGHMEDVALTHELRTVLIAMDCRRIASERLERFARRLIERGVTYFVCWGPGCKRMHDAADMERLRSDMELDTAKPLIMTTWHDSDSLEDTVEFWCLYGQPAADWGDVRTWATITIGNLAWHDRIHGYMDARLTGPVETDQGHRIGG